MFFYKKYGLCYAPIKKKKKSIVFTASKKKYGFHKKKKYGRLDCDFKEVRLIDSVLYGCLRNH